MSKPISFLDWENSFRKKTHSVSNISSIERPKTPLSIPMKVYKEYLEKWREENL